MGGHTKGPWRVGVSANNGIHCIDAGGMRSNATEICEVWGTKDDLKETAESRANARLIAAAPELLELAHQYLSDLRYPPTGDSLTRRMERIEALLARIEERPA